MNLRQVFSLSLIPTLYVLFVLLSKYIDEANAQNPDPLFELPVQLVGFPVIVLSVRLSQFAKKLAYSLNPNTYRSRAKRDAETLAFDVEMAQREILREFGPKACILEEPCRVHAARYYHHQHQQHRQQQQQSDSEMPGATEAQQHPSWNEILRHYKVQATGMKQWYLLSLFIGDAVRDVPLCRQLAKRLPCPGVGPIPPPQPR